MAGSQVACGVTCCVLLIASAIMFGVSWSSLDVTEAGIEYNANTLEINTEQLFDNGRHFLGLGHSFFVYPKDLQSVKFAIETGNAITARTKDGLVASLDVNFNYKLLANIGDLSRLYLDFGEMEDVTIAYNRIARNWVRVVAARYTALEFFEIREQIQADMQSTLDTQLRIAHGSVDSLQFLQMRLPSIVEDKQTEQNTAKEEAVQAANDRDVAIIDASSRVNAARKQAETIQLNAKASAQQISFNADAAISAAKARFEAESDSYGRLATKLGLEPAELLSYIWVEGVAQGTGAGRAKYLNLQAPSELDLGNL